MEDIIHDRIEQMIDPVMKQNPWQFNSPEQNGKKQKEEILIKTTQILCGEPVLIETTADRHYWAEALALARYFKINYHWLSGMEKTEIKQLMNGLKERIDCITICKSIKEELTNP